MTLTLGTSNALGPAINVGAYKQQAMDAFAQVHMWWSEWIPEPIIWLSSKFPKCRVSIEIPNNWQNPHTGSLTDETRTILIRKDK